MMSLLALVNSASIGEIAAALLVGSAVGAALGLLIEWRRAARAHEAGGDFSAGASAAERRVSSDESITALPSHAGGTRQVPTAGIPLPQRGAEETPSDQRALESVSAFADRLAELPVTAWLDVGRSLLAGRATISPRARAFASLEATMGDRGLAIAAWFVRDVVETSVFLASKSMRGWTSSMRRTFAATRAAAEVAALALLAREDLSASDFAVLYAPFEGVAPIDASVRLAPKENVYNRAPAVSAPYRWGLLRRRSTMPRAARATAHK